MVWSFLPWKLICLFKIVINKSNRHNQNALDILFITKLQENEVLIKSYWEEHCLFLNVTK